ncbi:response regulator transcription factor [Winogradskyella litoriviva]|uniref:Response regulator transcription factor n=1 Tax=Winogradskyella litoriviva TaxID=1220182 RepID=A0ABX2E7F9_9FLAO|nr:response regulator transcription factor [Winogradskyella litoriviva]NRD24087.1 response regulator transcription factor [Winogradskyella litoriviva]
MFSKVLISDDLGSVNQGVLKVLETLNITNVQQVQYCDDAYLKIKNAVLKEDPYQLLITDLSFVPDHRSQTYTSGEALVKQLKQEYPNLKIIVYSVEDRLQKVRTLIQTYKADAYVCKGRRGLIDLASAIYIVNDGKIFLSPQIEQALSPKSNLEIDDYDIELLQQLSNGLSQDEISTYLKNNSISPNSLSTVEKHLNKLRIQFKANNAIHLVAITKDLGLI